MGESLSQFRIDRILHLAKTTTIKQIAERLNIPIETIRRVLKREGVEAKPEVTFHRTMERDLVRDRQRRGKGGHR